MTGVLFGALYLATQHFAPDLFDSTPNWFWLIVGFWALCESGKQQIVNLKT